MLNETHHGPGDLFGTLSAGTSPSAQDYPALPSWLLPSPILCLITDRRLVGSADLPSVAAQAAAGGVTLVQLREKDLPTRALLELALRVREALAPHGVPLVVNGRADVAFAAGVAGVHLPADGLPVAGTRAALGPRALIGRSVHSTLEVAQSANERLDYLVLGTTFPSRSHPGSPTLGLDAIRATSKSAIPVVAIGGIDPENAVEVMAAGAAGVAVISSILAHPRPRLAAERLRAAMDKGWSERVALPAAAGAGASSGTSRTPGSLLSRSGPG